MWASHSNCRALVPHNRQFADEQIKELIARDAVIGAKMTNPADFGTCAIDWPLMDQWDEELAAGKMPE